MKPGPPRVFCEAALPVPMDRLYTYRVPAAMVGRVSPGCRIRVQFGGRTMTGVVLSTGTDQPKFETLPVRKQLDDAPSYTAEMLELGRWVAEYYCTPIGEVLKSMVPLGGEVRRSKVVSLTPRGVQKAETILDLGDAETQVLTALKRRPLTLPYLRSKVEGSGPVIESLRRRGLVTVDVSVGDRDPTRARNAVLMVEALEGGPTDHKTDAASRWLLKYLRRNPGRHDVRALRTQRSGLVPAARRLAKAGLLRLEASVPPRAVTTSRVELELTEDQRRALTVIGEALKAGEFRTFLLQGVTGSGKTEVYMRAVEAARALGRSVLLMVPEIALTPVAVEQFHRRFGDDVAVLHSGLQMAQRSDQWRRIRDGRASIVVGTRSAVFAPLSDLGLVIVDEEHDGSYKQGEAPRYNGRDVAIVRARSAAAVVVVGSATPGIETRANTENGKYQRLVMPHRIMRRPLPTVQVVDMRQEFTETGKNLLFSRNLATSVRNCLDRGEQAMILLNRRGYSTHVLCRSCGQRIECPNCSVTLTYHKGRDTLLCHYCEHAREVPEVCDECGRPYLHFHGGGSERVEDQLRTNFPEARIARLDRDTVKARDSYETILGSFRDGTCNLLVGTQMIAKGHDIPNVTLVCVVDADVGLGRPDFRAAERTFQLLTQVAGRAGRGEKPGRVLLQTMHPEHYAIAFAAQHDYEGFYEREIRFRKALWYPPFTVMATIVVRGGELGEVVAMSASLGQHLRTDSGDLRLLGPATAPMSKLRTEYRFQFVVKSTSRGPVARLLARARAFAEDNSWRATALVIDVDPVDLA